MTLLSEDTIKRISGKLSNRSNKILQSGEERILTDLRGWINKSPVNLDALPRSIKSKLSKSEIDKFESILAKNRIKLGKLRKPNLFYLTRREFISKYGSEMFCGALVLAIIGILMSASKPQSESIQRNAEPSLLDFSRGKFPFKTATLAPDGVAKRMDSSWEGISLTISKGIELKMISIPSGKISIGSRKELGRYSSEDPQHEVSVDEFFMSRTPITQAQWHEVAEFPRVKIDLNPNPSKSSGANRPVENISWEEAVEFCDRLSNMPGHTHKYRLPSEAEWEYACRAGTETPFHFGETLTAEVANYRATDSQDNDTGERLPGNYGNGPKGEFRNQTTDVESFPANTWGLYDMHGNVGEWRADVWHKNYEGSPTDGTAWEKNATSDRRVVRGGAWDQPPMRCRSASRAHEKSSHKDAALGFRVVATTRTGVLQGPSK